MKPESNFDMFAPEEPPIEWRFYVAGVKHHQLSTVIFLLKEEEEVQLIPEPTNKYDKNAIQIRWQDIMLGYVPKQVAAQILPVLKTYPLYTIIIELNPTQEPWQHLRLHVHP